MVGVCMSSYEISTIITLNYDESIKKVTEALKKEGFGILTEIDVKATLKNKLDVDFERYIILGACNPPFAKKVLDIDRSIGLLLPCNVVVQELKDGTTKVSAFDPEAMLVLVNNPQIQPIAQEIKHKLQNAIHSL